MSAALRLCSPAAGQQQQQQQHPPSCALQVLNSDASPAAAAAVMNRLAKLSARFIGDRGFSIGIDDVMPAASLQASHTAASALWEAQQPPRSLISSYCTS